MSRKAGRRERHRGEGNMIDNSLFYLSPHPNLLPEGEGTTSIIESYDFMSMMSLTYPGTHKTKGLPGSTIMLTGQQ